MLKKDNQNSQPKIKGPLIFEDNKWNNIPECIISFFNVLNAKIVEIETNHSSFKQKSEQSFTKQSKKVINECKTMSEETQMNFNLTNQTLTANMKEIKNKCENQNTMMRIKMEEELDKLNKRIDDITRGVNLKIDDNNELLVLIKKEADLTKQQFQELIEVQKNEQRLIDIVSSSSQIKQLIKDNSGIEDQLKELQDQVKKEAINTLNHLIDEEDSSDNQKNNNKDIQNNGEKQQSGGLLKKIEKKIMGKVENEMKQYKEFIEKNQVITNDLMLTLDKDLKKAKEQIEQIQIITRKCDKERKSMDSNKLEQKYGMLESQLSNFNENFEKIQENMNLISNTLSHKLNDKIKQRSVTPTQFNNITKIGNDSSFTSKLNEIPSQNKLNTISNNKQIELQIPTQNSFVKDETIHQEEETLEDKIFSLNQRISLLEMQYNQLKEEQKDTHSDEEIVEKKNNATDASKASLINKPWLSGQEVILKEGDNLAIKVFQKSQQINKKSSKYANMYQNPQAIVKKYRNSILGQDIDQLKANPSSETGVRSNSHTKFKEITPNPSNMTAYYKQNYMYDSSPEKSKKNSISGANSSNDLQFTNDLIKSQLDNHTHKAKQQLESMRTDLNWIEGTNNRTNQNEGEMKQINLTHANSSVNNNNNANNNLPLPPRSRNSRTFHSAANTAITSTTSYNLLNQSADQGNFSHINTSNNLNQSIPASMPQTGTHQLAMTQNANNFQPQKVINNQNESPLNSYKIAKNVMKNTKMKSFRISQGVSFDAINLSKY